MDIKIIDGESWKKRERERWIKMRGGKKEKGMKRLSGKVGKKIRGIRSRNESEDVRIWKEKRNRNRRVTDR